MVGSTSVLSQVFYRGKLALKNGRALSANESSKKCHLKFYIEADNVEDSTSRLDEEEDVARRQHEEDVRLYGSRSEPMDALEVDSDTESADSPTKNIITSYQTAFNEAKKPHKNESNSDNHEASIHIDGNAGVNPLSAWLTQSALPSVVPMCSHPLDQSTSPEVDLTNEETREIEKFRYVHLVSDSAIDGHASDTTKVKDPMDLQLPSQIYYRNIVDRYPLLPTYLARRLAEANSSRAERLSHQRVKAMAKAKDETATSKLKKAPKPIKRPGAGAGPLYGFENQTQQKPRESFVRAGTRVKKRRASTEAKYTWSSSSTSGPPFDDERPQSARKGANSYASLSNSQPKYDYWSGGSPQYRTKSVGTRSSSRNSSLHGSPKFCYQKQYQNIDYFASKPKYQYSSPSLPPPPVKLGKGQPSRPRVKRLSFDCDICGEKVKVDRRRQWQYVIMHEFRWILLIFIDRKHVMRDLRPYVCTALECNHKTETFPSILRYESHKMVSHDLYFEESIVCIFCGERTDPGKSGCGAREQHIGRHMEEIAFAVVPKAYEEWEFYSESSSANSRSYKQSKEATPKRNATSGGANTRLAGKASIPSREAIAKDARKHEIPAGCSLKNWDPEEKPILLLGSVFDANSLGKWIYDWTVFCHGAGTPMCDLAGELWLTLIKLAGKNKRIEVRSSPLTNSEAELLDDFLASAERLWEELKRLLEACEEYMWKSLKKRGEVKPGKESGREFVDMMFGRDRKLKATEALIQNMRLWIMRFDANCEDLLKTDETEGN